MGVGVYGAVECVSGLDRFGSYMYVCEECVSAVVDMWVCAGVERGVHLEVAKAGDVGTTTHVYVQALNLHHTHFTALKVVRETS